MEPTGLEGYDGRHERICDVARKRWDSPDSPYWTPFPEGEWAPQHKQQHKLCRKCAEEFVPVNCECQTQRQREKRETPKDQLVPRSLTTSYGVAREKLAKGYHSASEYMVNQFSKDHHRPEETADTSENTKTDFVGNGIAVAAIIFLVGLIMWIGGVSVTHLNIFNALFFSAAVAILGTIIAAILLPLALIGALIYLAIAAARWLNRH